MNLSYILRPLLVTLSLLFVGPTFSADKTNRDKYLSYIGNRYNMILETLNKLRGLSVYGKTNHDLGHLRYVPLKFPFPKEEQRQIAKMTSRFVSFPHSKKDPSNPLLNEIYQIGNDLDSIHQVVNSLFTSWTDDHNKKLKSLIPRINKLWNALAEDLRNNFSEDSATANEPFMKGYFRYIDNWEVKTVEDMDNE